MNCLLTRNLFAVHNGLVFPEDSLLLLSGLFHITRRVPRVQDPLGVSKQVSLSGWSSDADLMILFSIEYGDSTCYISPH